MPDDVRDRTAYASPDTAGGEGESESEEEGGTTVSVKMPREAIDAANELVREAEEELDASAAGGTGTLFLALCAARRGRVA